MDRRIREALEEIESIGTHDTLEGRSLIDGKVIPSQHVVTKSAKLAREALALLTAEPEPCEDAKKIATDIRCMSRWDAEKGAALIEAYASKAADKRAEELRAIIKTASLYLRAKQDKDDVEIDMIASFEKALAATEPKPSVKEN